jgi:hypothetical protein
MANSTKSCLSVRFPSCGRARTKEPLLAHGDARPIGVERGLKNPLLLFKNITKCSRAAAFLFEIDPL